MIDWRQLFADSNLDVVFRADDAGLWAETCKRLHFHPANYLGSALDYQLAYQRGQGGNWQDASSVLHCDNKPVAIWPLSVSERNGAAILSAQGMPVMPPLFVAECSERTRKKITAECLRLAQLLADRLKVSKWYSAPAFLDQTGISNWQLLSMEKGAGCAVRHELYVDLRLTLAEIKSKFRKSFRSLITSGERMWRVELLHSPGDGHTWDEFRALHVEVAGRVTRSLESWQIQHQALVADEGFLVVLRSADGRMVGAGYFMCSSDEGVYAVGAYDRSLFDKPIGHVVQYRAIEELKRRGCKWYRIGTRPYLSDDPPPTEKELAIGYFKEGFSSHVFPSFHLTHTTVSEGV